MRNTPVTDLSTLNVGDTVLFCGEVAGSYFDEDEAVLTNTNDEIDRDWDGAIEVQYTVYYFSIPGRGYDGWCVTNDDLSHDNIRNVIPEPSGLTKFLEGTKA